MATPRSRLSFWPLLTVPPPAVVAVGCLAQWPWGLTAALGGVATVGCASLLSRAFARERRAGDDLAGAIERFAVDQGHPIAGERPGDLAATAERLHEAATGNALRLGVRLNNVQNVLEASPWPMLATSGTGEVFLSNRAAEEFFQRGPGGLRGRFIEDLFTSAEVLTLHGAALAGRSHERQVRLPRSDGTRVYEVLAAPVQLDLGEPGVGSKTGVVLSLRDITELATAVQLKTDFVANASHELRTPLSSIRAAMETLTDGAWEDAQMRGRFSQMIAVNVQRLEDMIRDLLDLSRLESPEARVETEDVDLAELLRDIEEEIRPFAQERRVEFEHAVSSGAAKVRTDPRLLRLVLKNLMDNASKYAFENTAVRVVAEPWDAGGSKGVQLRVIDRGIGIPINQQQRVFERFFQVDPARTGFQHRRGTGLGLAIVKHALKALGGTIAVESVWKQGTTMVVSLPDCLVTSS